MERIRRLVADNEKFLIDVRRYLHSHPELSAEEYQTADYVRTWLREWGIPYVTVGNTGTVATIDGNEKGATIAIRGDMDALPIKENTGVSYASVNQGVMHACGHDFHTTFMLGTAKILCELQSQLKGRIKIIFQEGEEIGKGALDIMNAHIIDDADTIVGLHMSMEAPVGKFLVGYGVMSSYGGGADIVIEGGKTSNAIQIASYVIEWIGQRSFELFPGTEQVVLVPTVVRTVNNDSTTDVGSKIVLTYNFRTLNADNYRIMENILGKVSEVVKVLFGGHADVKIVEHANVVNNDAESTDRAIRVISELYGEDVVCISRPFMGGEDFSVYQKTIPGVFLHVGGVSDGQYGALHTDVTNFDESALRIGTEYLLSYIWDFLKYDEII